MGSLPKLLVRLTTKERHTTNTEKGEDLPHSRHLRHSDESPQHLTLKTNGA